MSHPCPCPCWCDKAGGTLNAKPVIFCSCSAHWVQTQPSFSSMATEHYPRTTLVALLDLLRDICLSFFLTSLFRCWHWCSLLSVPIWVVWVVSTVAKFISWTYWDTHSHIRRTTSPLCTQPLAPRGLLLVRKDLSHLYLLLQWART